MFTGIISDIGTIISHEQSGDDIRLRIQTAYDTSTIDLGASIACNGICLTVTETNHSPSPRKQGEELSDWFAVTASSETANVTTLKDWRVNTNINLERALRMGDELGGHMVSGHIDGVGRIAQIEPDSDCFSLTITCPNELLRYMAKKGSVALDGISLTINDVNDPNIELMIIPHTWAHTTLQQRKAGDAINIEIDLLARYVERMTKVKA